MRQSALWIIAVTTALAPMSAIAQRESETSAFGPRSTFMVTGYGFVNAVSPEDHISSFAAGFNPIFLWKAQHRLFFEAEVEFELEEGTTNVGLEYGQVWWFASNYMIFGGGKFLSPTNNFVERLHPTWINKLPTMPLGVSGHGGGVPLIASTQIGVQARGGVPAGPIKLTYAVYVANGPRLNTEEEGIVDSTAVVEGGHEHEAMSPGTLNFSNTSDNNSDKAIGGHVAILPTPNLEIGYGFETAQVGDDDSEFEDVRSLSHSVDLTYINDTDVIKGRVDVRGQFVWLDVDNPNIDPLEYDNQSSAWYAQIAYQPARIANAIVSRIELVFRYDQIDLPEDAELNEDSSRITGGVNYWFTSSGVFKFAFERMTTEHEDGDLKENTVIGQMALGF